MKLVNPRHRPGTVAGNTIVGHHFYDWLPLRARRSWTYPERSGRGVGLRVVLRRKHETV